MILSDIIKRFEKIMPLSLQATWDHSGLNLGTLRQEVDRVLLSYDVCLEAVRFAHEKRCDLIVSHHPLRLSADVDLNLDDAEGRIIAECIQKKISLYSCHTNHDASLYSPNRFYLKQLNVQRIKSFPQKSQDPVCAAHGGLLRAMSQERMISLLKRIFAAPHIRFIGSKKSSFKKVGICTGSGAAYLDQAIDLGLDLFITGDVKYHQAIHAKRYDLAVADVGHFYSEQASVLILKDLFKKIFGKKLQLFVYDSLVDPFEFL